MERAFAAALLAAALPAVLLAACAIALLSRRTPLVRHTRVGWRGAKLGMLKLRTMWEREAERGPLFTIEDVCSSIPVSKREADDRVSSRFAAFCRRFSLDELPQLYHVMRGEMSFVGPRPITRAELDEHYGTAAGAVLSMRPGLTGLWQVLGRSRLSYVQRRRLDLWLVRSASPRLYFWILWRSIPRVLRGHDAC
jgi:exopolysaccharide production protein ExoY